ncbi:MAG: YncE family protein [Alphaproteobacteria bacterium]|nr:YncE family protein [Alphaproteobacteria bacterium]MDE2498865.1 YncE family protein [Alphaproteobacteria bacterium]
MRHLLKPLLVAAAFCATTAAAAAASHGSLLVVTKQSRSVAIVDGTTLKVTAHVPVGENPHEVVVGPDNKTAYVSNFLEGTGHTIAVVDLVHARALPHIPVAPLVGPHGMAVHDGILWFTADRSQALGELDLRTHKIVGVLGTGQMRTHMLWISRDGKKIVASNAGSGTMSVYDSIIISPTMAPGAPPPPAAYTSPGWKPTLIPVGQAAEGFAVSPDETEVWVGNNEGTISIIDLATEKVSATIDPGTKGANRLTFTPDGKLVFVTMRAGKNLAAIDAHTRQVVKLIPIEQRGASGVQMQPDGSRVFVACPRDHYVAVVDVKTLTMTDKIDAGPEPDGLAWWEPTRPSGE